MHFPRILKHTLSPRLDTKNDTYHFAGSRDLEIIQNNLRIPVILFSDFSLYSQTHTVQI